MVKCIGLVLFTLLSVAVLSQNTIMVVDGDSKKPLEGIQARIEGEVFTSDKNGKIQFSELKEGNTVELTSKFYKSITIQWTKSMRQVEMTRLSTIIKETEIVGRRPQIKIEAGKISLDASQATVQQGTLKDLIQQIPGAIIDNNSNISVRGKSGFRVLVDGKTSQMALADMKTFLESLPAQSIKSIEVLTNPGAQYDAQGKGGIIHIKLKKDKKEGFNTKISAGIGSVWNKYNTGISSNYKNEKINIFGNYQFNYNNQWYGYSENRISNLNSMTQYYNYVASWENISRTHNAKAGIDLFLDKNTTLSYTSDYNTSIHTGNNHNENPSEVLDENRIQQSKYLAYNLGKNNITTLSNGLSMRKTFDSSDVEWTADVSHTYFKESNTNINENFAFDALGNSLNNQYYYFEPVLDNQVQNIMVKSDLALPLKFCKLDFGIKNESNFNKNAYIAYLKNYGTAKYTTPSYQNDFNYNDNVFAAYLNASRTFKFVQVDFGFRAENTIISSNNPAVGRQYLNLFPTIGISSPLDSSTNISVRYSKRIQRPSFNQLNNRIVYYNRFTANVGVPTLQPELIDVFSMQLDRTFLQGALNLAWGNELNMESNDIAEFNFIDSTFTSYFTYGNIGTANLFNSYVNIYFKPTPIFDINLTPTYTYSFYNTNYNGVENTSKGSAFQLSSQLNLYLPKRLKFSLNGWMSTNMVWAQGHSDFLGNINASISKSIWNNKLNIELSCSDILNSNIWVGYQSTGNIRSRGIWKPETRIAWLNISYAFGGKINYKRKEIEKSERIKATGR